MWAASSVLPSRNHAHLVVPGVREGWVTAQKNAEKKQSLVQKQRVPVSFEKVGEGGEELEDKKVRGL